MSRIRADRIVNRAATGAPSFPNGAVVTGVCTATSFSGNATGLAAGATGSDLTLSGNVSVGGTLTYQDVTNVDSVGLITARSGVDFNGNEIIWNVESDEAKKSVVKKVKKSNYYDPAPLTYPNKAYGFSTRPVSQNTLFKNATVWTNEDEGILKTTDVLVIDGKIAEIGDIESNQNYVTIDATGKHLTTGIVDEHSHLGASSINEGGQNSSAEVSIEDVIEPDDIGLYRDLTGGVTTIQILHGSANPIGGRSAIGDALAIFPPTVPRFLICVEPICPINFLNLRGNNSFFSSCSYVTQGPMCI